jgi:cell division protein ZapA
MENVEVYILGQKYIIKGDASADYIKHLSDFVDRKLKEAYLNSPNITPLKAAILASLNIADELHRLKDEYNAISQGIRQMEDKTDTIIKLFD